MYTTQDFEREIIHSLFTGSHKNYNDYKGYVLSTLAASDISPDYKNAIQQSIGFLASHFDGIPCSAENMRNIAQLAGEELLFAIKKTTEIQATVEIRKLTIPDNLPDMLHKKYGIRPLKNENVAYKGGVARMYAREILGIENPDADRQINDIDLWAKAGLDHKQVMQEYNADTFGIHYITEFSDRKIQDILSSQDVTMNQIIIHHKYMYISQDAIQALQTKTIRPVHEGKNFFGSQSYAIGDQVVFHPRQLLRAVKFLLEKKGNFVSIPQHNIQKENLELLQIEKQVLVFVRRIYQKHLSDRAENLFVFAKLLEQWGVVVSIDSFFEYLGYHISQSTFQMTTPVENIQKDAHRRLSKYISLALETIVGADQEELWDNYDFSVTQEIKIHRPSETNIPDSFLIQEKEFAQMYHL